MSLVRVVSPWDSHTSEARWVGMALSTMSLAAAAFDASPSVAAVLTPEGTILIVNRAWRQYGRDNGAGSRCGVGTNYLDVTARSAAAGDELAAAVSAALEAVLGGHAAEARFDYPCHAPDRQRWFRLQAVPLMNRGGLLVVHNDITDLVQAATSRADRMGRSC